MSDRIDPGPGWRLLDPKEIIKFGDERRLFGKWVESLNAGMRQVCGFAYRRRISAPRTTKAIATRATLKTAYDGGTTITRTMRNDEGLSEREMIDASEVFFDKVEAIRNRTSIPKYIMLEIQREGEP